MKSIRNYLISAAFICFSISLIQAQSIVGKWKTVDDESGKTRSIIELYNQNGKIYGKVLTLLLPEDKGKVCINCTGEDYNQPIEGLVFVKNLSKEGDEYKGGTIFDPENGKEYKCKMWIEDDAPNTLNVRGYIAFFYRTQQWYRVDE